VGLVRPHDGGGLPLQVQEYSSPLGLPASNQAYDAGDETPSPRTAKKAACPASAQRHPFQEPSPSVPIAVLPPRAQQLPPHQDGLLQGAPLQPSTAVEEEEEGWSLEQLQQRMECQHQHLQELLVEEQHRKQRQRLQQLREEELAEKEQEAFHHHASCGSLAPAPPPPPRLSGGPASQHPASSSQQTACTPGFAMRRTSSAPQTGGQQRRRWNIMLEPQANCESVRLGTPDALRQLRCGPLFTDDVLQHLQASRSSRVGEVALPSGVVTSTTLSPDRGDVQAAFQQHFIGTPTGANQSMLVEAQALPTPENAPGQQVSATLPPQAQATGTVLVPGLGGSLTAVCSPRFPPPGSGHLPLAVANLPLPADGLGLGLLPPSGGGRPVVIPVAGSSVGLPIAAAAASSSQLPPQQQQLPTGAAAAAARQPSLERHGGSLVLSARALTPCRASGRLTPVTGGAPASTYGQVVLACAATPVASMGGGGGSVRAPAGTAGHQTPTPPAVAGQAWLPPPGGGATTPRALAVTPRKAGGGATPRGSALIPVEVEHAGSTSIALALRAPHAIQRSQASTTPTRSRPSSVGRAVQRQLSVPVVATAAPTGAGSSNAGLAGGCGRSRATTPLRGVGVPVAARAVSPIGRFAVPVVVAPAGVVQQQQQSQPTPRRQGMNTAARAAARAAAASCAPLAGGGVAGDPMVGHPAARLNRRFPDTQALPVGSRSVDQAAQLSSRRPGALPSGLHLQQC